MTTATPHPTKPTKAAKLHAERCALCGRALTRPGTLLPGFGVLGPECQEKMGARTMHLQAAGLGDLTRDGEVRFPMVKKGDTWTHDRAALNAWTGKAARVGLDLKTGMDVSTPGQPATVLTIDPRSLARFLAHTGRLSATAHHAA